MKHDILFVDDDKSVRNMYGSMLEKHNYSVSTAASGIEAMRLLETNSYQLIFLDLNMPEMNGLEALREIRKKDTKTPIFVITAFEHEFFDELKKLRETGIKFQMLKKPIEKDKLLSVADGVLLKGHSSSDPALKLRVYVAGKSDRMAATIDKLHEIIQDAWAGEFFLEVIDVLESPEIAEQDKVIATPTLCKISPAPIKRIIGDLSVNKLVLGALGL